MAMNPMGGIDQQIQQRKMQFKDNPQQLQQRYGQNKELLDLLALQEISKEQQQRSQRMQMEAQQNPATIADQMQQEVLQGKKAEMAQGLQGIKGLRERTKDVGGALAQKQQQQQQRMQQQGQQPQRPPQQQQRPQGQPMMAAAGGLMTQAAPNIDPRYFEGGGIVAFQLGGRVQALIEEYRKKTAGARNLSDEEILDRLETARPTEVAEYRKKMYGTTGKSDAEIEQEIGESFSGKLKAARTADLSDRGRAPDPMSMGLGMGMGMGSPTLEPLAAERMEYTGAVAPAEKVVAEEEEEEGETVADEALAVGEEAGTAAADETELSTLQQVLKGAKQFGLPDDSAAPDAPLAQAKPVDDYLLNPAAQAARQGDRQREAFSANEARLNMGMPTGGLETLDRSNLAPTQGGRPLPGAPEMLRRAPEKELTLEQEFEALRRKQLADLKRDEEGLKDTRSNTRRLLDRLTDAAVNASKRPAATTNRGALASLGLGVSEAVRAEEAERKEGLAGIRDRRSKLLASELERKQALAQIGQGQQELDLKSTEIANNLGINVRRVENEAQRLNMDTERYANALAQSSKEFALTAAFRAMDFDAQTEYRRDTAALKTRELNLKDEATKARTDASKQDLMVQIANAKVDAQNTAREAEQSVLDTFRAQGFKDAELAEKTKTAVDGIRADRDALIASLNAIASGTGIAMPASGAAGGASPAKEKANAVIAASR
jgi:hypothetical protein